MRVGFVALAVAGLAVVGCKSSGSSGDGGLLASCPRTRRTT